MTVFLNGALVADDEARIAPSDRGFTLGDGLFETLKVKAGVPMRLSAHLARLARGAQVIGLKLPTLDFAAILAQTLAANAIADGSARITVTRGSGPRGVLPPAAPAPTVLVTCAPAAPPAGPARLVIARSTRRNEFSPLASIKSLNYLDNILARQEATARGADDGILLNTQGRVTETSIANLFALVDGRLVTPPVSEGVLPGVMRAEVLAHGVEEAPLTEDDLARASEIFLTSSLGIRKVAGLEGRTLPDHAEADRLLALLG